MRLLLSAMKAMKPRDLTSDNATLGSGLEGEELVDSVVGGFGGDGEGGEGEDGHYHGECDFGVSLSEKEEKDAER